MNITFFEDAWNFSTFIERRPEQPDAALIMLGWSTNGREEQRYQHAVDMLLMRNRPAMIELVVNSMLLESLGDIARHYDLVTEEIMSEAPESVAQLRSFIENAIATGGRRASADINDFLRANEERLTEEFRPTFDRAQDRIHQPFNFTSPPELGPVSRLTQAQLDETYRRLMELSSRPETVRRDVREANRAPAQVWRPANYDGDVAWHSVPLLTNEDVDRAIENGRGTEAAIAD